MSHLNHNSGNCRHLMSVVTTMVSAPTTKKNHDFVPIIHIEDNSRSIPVMLHGRLPMGPFTKGGKYCNACDIFQAKRVSSVMEAKLSIGAHLALPALM